MNLLHRNRENDHERDLDVEQRAEPHPYDIPADRNRRRQDDTAVVERHTAHQREVVADADDHVKTSERVWTFAPGQLVSLIVGVGAVAIGLLAMVRAGIDGSFETPTVEVLGFTHTAWLGLAEVGVGVLLILAGIGAWGRPLSVILGAGMVIAGVLIGVAPDEMPAELAVEEDFGWALAAIGAVVAIAALALPVWRTRRVKRNGELIADDRETVSAH
ncbi:MAG: hypothetical protein ABWZ52_11545 [Acidimicrobiales bacterium]